MNKNPIINGLAAFLYILLVVLTMNLFSKTVQNPNSLIMPMAFISLFTLSAAVMGYLFCFRPIQLYFDGKKEQAVRFFLQTVGVFGGITALLLAALLSGILS